jgi:hypothetical protein
MKRCRKGSMSMKKMMVALKINHIMNGATCAEPRYTMNF